ncbi:Nodulin-like [Parasponia andersonii]|uniref:Nodulin-like n=1 Tax=Parasponia andersonii TaxID=3476 RepID=A0A2P5CJ28_PARAD|nr:Nodulin-like [Parasponia andersonii]
MGICLFIFLGAHAQAFFDTANVVSGVHNSSGYSGTIVGIMKGFNGLSGAILVQFYATVCKGKPSTFTLMLARLPTFGSLLLMSLVRIHEANKGDEKKYLNALSLVSLAILAHLLIIIIWENKFITLSTSSRISIFVLFLFFLASPLGIAIKAQLEDLKAGALETSSITEENPLDYEELPSSDQDQVKVSSNNTMFLDEEEEDMNYLSQALGTYY